MEEYFRLFDYAKPLKRKARENSFLLFQAQNRSASTLVSNALGNVTLAVLLLHDHCHRSGTAAKFICRIQSVGCGHFRSYVYTAPTHRSDLG
jgi:hypothetical protein